MIFAGSRTLPEKSMVSFLAFASIAAIILNEFLKSSKDISFGERFTWCI
jgi:hypothetical protein